MKIIIILSFIILLIGCAPKGPGNEYGSNVRPVDLQVEVNHKSMDISWKKSGNGAFSGYNIYIEKGPSSMISTPDNTKTPPFNSSIFPGDTNPDDGVEHFLAEGLENSVDYYVSVAAVYPDGSLSNFTNEIKVVCGGRGEIELAMRYNGNNDGFSFVENKYVSADATSNDLYFFSKNGVDQLGSPSRLNGFLNESKLIVLPMKGSFDEVIEMIPIQSVVPTEDLVEISEGDWVLIQSANSKYSLVKVNRFSSMGRNRTCHLLYAYSVQVNELLF